MDIINFGTGNLYGLATNDYLGNPLANPTPVKFANLQEADIEISFDEKMLYGSGQFPIAVGRGNGKISLTAKTATVSAAAYSSLFFGKQLIAGIKALSEENATTIPASPYTVTATPPAGGTYVTDLGVFNALTGQQFVQVASAPTTGQYTINQSTGAYVFAAADTGKAIVYNYEYSATSTTAMYLPLTNTKMGQMPFFSARLQTQYGGGTITLGLNRVASNKFSMPHKNDDFAVPDFDASAFADAAGNIGYMAFSQ